MFTHGVGQCRIHRSEPAQNVLLRFPSNHGNVRLLGTIEFMLHSSCNAA